MGAAADRFAPAPQQDVALRRGAALYQFNEPFQNLFSVRSGALKSYRIIGDGEERVLAFHLPGDFIGMEAIGHGRYYSSVVALEDTRVCAIPYDELQAVCEQLPDLHTAMVRMMCRTLGTGKASLTSIAKYSAEERVLGVLTDIRTRLDPENGFGGAFRLPMTRADIGNYLGLTAETVSRMLLRLRERGVIAVSGRTVEILDFPSMGLKAMGDGRLTAGASR